MRKQVEINNMQGLSRDISTTPLSQSLRIMARENWGGCCWRFSRARCPLEDANSIRVPR